MRSDSSERPVRAALFRIAFMRIAHLLSAEPGWKAVFEEPNGSESQSRILGWAVVGAGEKSELVGVIVDPVDPSRIIPAVEAASPDGGTFLRYRFVPPEPPPALTPPPAPEPPAQEDTAEKVARTVLRRRR
jgi:hypothetical protein